MLPLWPLAVLTLAVSTFTDLRYKKIYNLITLPVMFLGLAYHTATGNPWFGLMGLMTGFLMLWPMYWMGGTRAGDVKLLASVGAILGNQAVLITGMTTSLLFLGYAVIFYVRRRELIKWFSLTLLNAKYLALRQLDGEKVSPEEIAGGEHTAPFAPFIAAGALIYYILGVVHWHGLSVF